MRGVQIWYVEKLTLFAKKSNFTPYIFAYMREKKYLCRRNWINTQYFRLTKNTKHMKKLFTLAAAMLASLNLFAALPLDSLPMGQTTSFTSEFWGSTVDKNKVIYNQSNQIMMYSQGNALTFKGDTMYIGNSSKVSAFVFRIAEAADITATLAYNNSDATVTLYYMGETTDELTSKNLATAGTKTCGSALVKSDFTGGITAKGCEAGYYKVVGSLRFAIKNITLSAPTAADHTKATVTSISVGGKALADFAEDKLSYEYELEFDATEAPIVAAQTANDATVQITQADTVPGAATVVCKSYDETTSVTYTINFTKEKESPIIRATHTGKTTASVKGTIGGTAEKSTQDDGKLGSNGHYFGIKLAKGTFLEGDSLVIVATLNGGNTATLFTEKEGTNEIASPEFDVNTGICSYVLTADASAIYLVRKSSSCNPTVKMMQVYRPVDDGQPKLNVNPAEVDLNVLASEPSVSAKVTFSGKHLAAGEYALTVPDLAGLTIAPTSVTVGADGKLNAEVTLTYATTADVAAAKTTVSLTIGALTKSVTVNYSAVQAKKYMTGAIYIDQLILDNGTKYDIKSALDAANIEYASLNALDSLNDDKAKRNEPYLGLKMKTQGAYIAGWLKAGDKISLRFGYVTDSIKASINGNSEIWNATDNALTDRVWTATEDSYMKFETTTGGTVVLKQITINADLKDVTLPAQSKFLVTCTKPENGTLTVGSDKKSSLAFAAGETVVLNVTPATGYEIDSVTINGKVLEAVENVYSFVMPAENVTAAAYFVAVAPTLYSVVIDGETVNGTVSIEGGTLNFEEGTVITLTNTPRAGYELEKYIVYKSDDETVLVTVTDGKFTMPAYNVTISGTFKAKEEGIEDINADAKAVKRFVNGVLVIEKNGRLYNAQGAELR